MHTVWAWLSPLSLAEVAPASSVAGWGLAVGSVATLVALPRFARRKRSVSNPPSSARGNRTERQADTARSDAATALSAIPANILELFEDPNAVQVALPAILLFRVNDRDLLEATSQPQYADPIRSLWDLLDGIEPRERVALIDKSLQSLAASPPKQAKQVLQFLRELTTAAGEAHWQFQAWCQLSQDTVVAPRVPKRAKFPQLIKLLQEMVDLVSIASVVAEDGSLAQYRFHRGWSHLDLPHASVLPADVLGFSDLESALAKAVKTPARTRARICNACTMALTTDGLLDETQVAMFRLIRQRLGHPPFPILPGPVLG